MIPCGKNEDQLALKASSTELTDHLLYICEVLIKVSHPDIVANKKVQLKEISIFVEISSQFRCYLLYTTTFDQEVAHNIIPTYLQISIFIN